MNIANAGIILDATKKHSQARKPAMRWLCEVFASKWAGPSDIKAAYASASFLAGNRVVFNIGGNSFRAIVVVVYEEQEIIVRWFGTHAEYDEIDVLTV